MARVSTLAVGIAPVVLVAVALVSVAPPLATDVPVGTVAVAVVPPPCVAASAMPPMVRIRTVATMPTIASGGIPPRFWGGCVYAYGCVPYDGGGGCPLGCWYGGPVCYGIGDVPGAPYMPEAGGGCDGGPPYAFGTPPTGSA